MNNVFVCVVGAGSRSVSYSTLHDEALKVFSLLLQLELTSDPVPLIQTVLRTLRDEQTVRPLQAGGATHLSSWKLLTCIRCTFDPSRSILRYLNFHLKRSALAGGVTKAHNSANI